MDLFYNIIGMTGLTHPIPLYNYVVPICVSGLPILVACAVTFKPLYDKVFNFIKSIGSSLSGNTPPNRSESQENVVTIGRIRQRPKDADADTELDERQGSAHTGSTEHVEWVASTSKAFDS